LLTSLQDALDRRRGELTRSAHPDAPLLARRGEPTPNTPSVGPRNHHGIRWGPDLSLKEALLGADPKTWPARWPTTGS